jgi:hypothetical protein
MRFWQHNQILFRVLVSGSEVLESCGEYYKVVRIPVKLALSSGAEMYKVRCNLNDDGTCHCD